MLCSARPSASPSTYSPSMPLRSFLPHMPPMMRASTCTVGQQCSGWLPQHFSLLQRHQFRCARKSDCETDVTTAKSHLQYGHS